MTDDLPMVLAGQCGGEPGPGHVLDAEAGFEEANAVVGGHGREIADVGQLADLAAALPRDMSVTLDEVVRGVGPGPYGVTTLVARVTAMPERHFGP
ncbi:hypothetical protein ABT299_43100 [Spirillospora sp. NPDC000708]